MKMKSERSAKKSMRQVAAPLVIKITDSDVQSEEDASYLDADLESNEEFPAQVGRTTLKNLQLLKNISSKESCDISAFYDENNDQSVKLREIDPIPLEAMQEHDDTINLYQSLDNSFLDDFKNKMKKKRTASLSPKKDLPRSTEKVEKFKAFEEYLNKSFSQNNNSFITDQKSGKRNNDLSFLSEQRVPRQMNRTMIIPGK